MIAITIAFVALVGIHASLAFGIGLKTHGLQRWKLLGGLAIITAIVWLILAGGISVMNLLDAPRAGPAIEAYGHTFGLPFAWNLPDRFLGLPVGQTPIWLEIVCTVSVVACIAFIVAVVSASLARLVLRTAAIIKK